MYLITYQKSGKIRMVPYSYIWIIQMIFVALVYTFDIVLYQLKWPYIRMMKVVKLNNSTSIDSMILRVVYHIFVIKYPICNWVKILNNCSAYICTFLKNHVTRVGLCLFEDIANGFPQSCEEVQKSGGQGGYHISDPEQDGLDPISMFCNMHSIPVTAVLEYNLEDWTLINSSKTAGSYNGQVSYVINIGHRHQESLHLRQQNKKFNLILECSTSHNICTGFCFVVVILS